MDKNSSKNYSKKSIHYENIEINNTWTEFINNEKYKEYFMNNEEQWKQTLAKLKEFIDENHRRPINIAKTEEKFFEVDFSSS